MIPWAMNRDVKFVKNFGPSLNPMIPNETKILQNISISTKLEPLKNSIIHLRNKLPKSIGLIGFAGAPWTLACYMIEGGSSRDYVTTRKLLWNDEKLFVNLINKLTNVCIDFLEFQYLKH